jgi:hypothetical protein
MDEEKIDPGELQLFEALIEGGLEIVGGKLITPNLGGHENILALDAGGTQPPTQSFPNLALVAIALGGIDMAITDTKRGLDRFDADRFHQRHGSEADRGDLCAVSFDEIHRLFPTKALARNQLAP